MDRPRRASRGVSSEGGYAEGDFLEDAQPKFRGRAAARAGREAVRAMAADIADEGAEASTRHWQLTRRKAHASATWVPWARISNRRLCEKLAAAPCALLRFARAHTDVQLRQSPAQHTTAFSRRPVVGRIFLRVPLHLRADGDARMRAHAGTS